MIEIGITTMNELQKLFKLLTIPKEFKNYGYTLMNTKIGKHKPWDEINTDYKTVMDSQSLYNILQFNHIAPNGIAVECGVYEGGISKMLMDRGREVYAFDTFEGMINSDADSIIKNGEFSVQYDEVSKYLYGATLIKGDVIETLPNCYYELSDRLAFVHLDMDMYEPTFFALSYLYNIMVLDGVIVLDDYGNWMTPGIKKAVDKMGFSKTIYLPTGQMVIMK